MDVEETKRPKGVKVFMEEGVLELDANYVLAYLDDDEEGGVHLIAVIDGDGRVVDKMATTLSIQAGELFSYLTTRKKGGYDNGF